MKPLLTNQLDLFNKSHTIFQAQPKYKNKIDMKISRTSSIKHNLIAKRPFDFLINAISLQRHGV